MSNTEESGKSKRGKGWEALENVEYMKAISKLALTDETVQDDPRWKQVSKDVVELGKCCNPVKSWEIRLPNAVREHLKEMMSIIRSISSTYSTTENALVPPDPKDADRNPVDHESADFILKFREYTDRLHQHYVTLLAEESAGGKKEKSKLGGAKWWCPNLIFEVRLFCWKHDNRRVLAKAPPAVSKFQQETDAKKEAMLERKRKIEEDEKEEKERRVKLLEHVSSSSVTMSEISSTFKGMVDFLRTPPPNQRQGGDVAAQESKVEELENKIERIEDKVDRGFAQIMALLQARPP